jgi:hypothetical protein
MRDAPERRQILDPIVQVIPVAMLHWLVPLQHPTHRKRREQPMLHDVFVLPRHR